MKGRLVALVILSFLLVLSLLSVTGIFNSVLVKTTGEVIAPGTSCGNGIIEGTEQCDRYNLNSKNCVSQLGTGSTGTLKCSTSCTFDTSLCTACKAETNDAFCFRMDKNCNLVTGTDNCGQSRRISCGVCSLGSTCVNGNCVVNPTSSCPPGYLNCDGVAANGCERLTSVSHGTLASCSAVTCTSGYGNCDANAINGCETSLLTNAASCGSCGNVCTTGKTCSGGTCAGCIVESDASFCNRFGISCGNVSGIDNCGNPKTVKNCGNCAAGQTCNWPIGKCVVKCDINNPCPNGQICNAISVCVSSCAAPATCASLGRGCGSWSDNCGGNLNCGSCTSTQTCSNGVCVSSCGTGGCEAAKGETCSTCPGDCGCSTEQTCNNGVCVAGKLVPCSYTNPCNKASTCVNGFCRGGWCADGKCNDWETCSTCAVDCGACAKQSIWKVIWNTLV